MAPPDPAGDLGPGSGNTSPSLSVSFEHRVSARSDIDHRHHPTREGAGLLVVVQVLGMSEGLLGFSPRDRFIGRGVRAMQPFTVWCGVRRC
ncbi:hypothetical protein, partial [Kocuria coralli]|uniref:hypothetical protein n=1 Tax=Kocuria coralli TaxID=1461025 RepID=UPI001C70AEBC